MSETDSGETDMYDIEELLEALKRSNQSLGRHDYCRCEALHGEECTVHFVERVIKKHDPTYENL